LIALGNQCTNNTSSTLLELAAKPWRIWLWSGKDTLAEIAGYNISADNYDKAAVKKTVKFKRQHSNNSCHKLIIFPYEAILLKNGKVGIKYSLL